MSEHEPTDNGAELVHTGHDDPEHELVELGLGALSEPRRSDLVTQLATCRACRLTYDEIVGGIDVVLSAAPATAPPAGFDVRVLQSLGIDERRASAPTRLRPTRRRTNMLVAAAALLVALAGGVAVGAVVAERGADSPAQEAADTSTLVKDDGEPVGTASVGWLDDERVLVLSVNKPVVGVGYRCRVLVEGGDAMTLARWESASEDGGTWVVPTPKGKLAGVELVTDSGEVWASTNLPG